MEHAGAGVAVGAADGPGAGGVGPDGTGLGPGCCEPAPLPAAGAPLGVGAGEGGAVLVGAAGAGTGSPGMCPPPGRGAPGWCRQAGDSRRGLGGRRRDVVPVQIVLPHQADELRAVARVGGIDPGERLRERVRVPPVGHGLAVVAAGGEELAVIVDAFRGAVVDAERAGGRHQLAVLVLLRRQRIAARWARALDAEQVVVLGRQRALSPARLVDGLGDRDRCRDTVLALRGHGSGRHLANERLLAAGVMHRRRGGRRVVPLVVRCRRCLRAGDSR